MRRVLLITLVVLIIDIITKQLVINNLVLNQSIIVINNFFNISYVRNTGIAFSLLEGKLFMVIILTIVIVLVIINYLRNNSRSKKEVISYGLILGGAIGNLLDRIVYGYVIDFIDIYIGDNHFPTFNIADSCIVIGVLLVLLFSKKEGDINGN